MLHYYLESRSSKPPFASDTPGVTLPWLPLAGHRLNKIYSPKIRLQKAQFKPHRQARAKIVFAAETFRLSHSLPLPLWLLLSLFHENISYRYGFIELEINKSLQTDNHTHWQERNFGPCVHHHTKLHADCIGPASYQLKATSTRPYLAVFGSLWTFLQAW